MSRLSIVFLPFLFLLVACGGGHPTVVANDAAASLPSILETIQADAPAPAPTATPAPPAPPVYPAPDPWAAAPTLRNGVMPPVYINGIEGVVVDEASRAVLFDKHANVAIPPASLTKIATLILALESGRSDEWVDIDVDSREMRGSSVMGIIPGDRFTLRDLEYGLMLPSGNDAALAIGRFLAGSDAAFVAQMNQLLVRLGLHDSHFLNAHGLGGGGHVASPYDLAMLARYGMSLPGFKEIVNTRSYVARGERTIPLTNVNTFLNGYRGADGTKTGYTRSAGQTLVASATRNGHRLYAVVLNSPTRDQDAATLLDWAFANYVWP